MTVREVADRVRQLKFDRLAKLRSMQTSLKKAIDRGYEFGAENVWTYTEVIQIEREIRALESLLK